MVATKLMMVTFEGSFEDLRLHLKISGSIWRSPAPWPLGVCFGEFSTNGGELLAMEAIMAWEKWQVGLHKSQKSTMASNLPMQFFMWLLDDVGWIWIKLLTQTWGGASSILHDQVWLMKPDSYESHNQKFPVSWIISWDSPAYTPTMVKQPTVGGVRICQNLSPTNRVQLIQVQKWSLKKPFGV